MKNFIALVLVTLITAPAFAAEVFTVSGKIIKPDGQPLHRPTVWFKVQIKSPNADNCLLYEEIHNSVPVVGGVFSMNVGTGSRLSVATDGGNSLATVLQNAKLINLSAATDACATAATSYSPGATDNRKIIVTFDEGDGPGPQTLGELDLNYAPMALYANTARTVLELLNVPIATATPTSGDVLQYNGTSWTPVALGSSFPNANLSNLSSTAVNAHLSPDSSATRNLGDSAATWNAVYAVDLQNTSTSNISLVNRLMYDGSGASSIDYAGRHLVSGTNKLSWGTSGEVSMNSNRVSSVATPTATSDAATKGYVDQAMGVVNASSATSFDLSQGQTFYTSASCGAMTLSNMQEGKLYTIIVKGTVSGTCVFTHAGLTIRFSPASAATVTGSQTVYTLLRAGNDVYANYVTGF